uniref:Uncharacterized protein n=1 Tax=Lactuca sativa TaxID=4236 RepID=A0A9R1UJQ7_LACSA|nr:hypothetical protein LSAT_V11C900486930 [Lactuca sativa]
MIRMGRQQEQNQIELDNLHQRMDYHHSNWMNFNSRMNPMENQNDIALSLAYGIEERQVALKESHEALEERHVMAGQVVKLANFDITLRIC